ncbi:hypothetical protein ANN_06283 [Periplaneta americana]|uniref:Uncharacterized protein n=1 Tax=Periplaneta americana TaxID=6978 RepID=A0ABQ8TD51_PERAM|nr:hypothetical protein ANN_06283 [Periplaneta americana]
MAGLCEGGNEPPGSLKANKRSARVPRLDHIKNEEIRHRMDAEETVLNRIENKSLKWFGHLMRMGEDRWPKQIYQWKPPGRRRKGRLKRTWDNEVMEVMHKRGLRTEDAQDRRLWRIGTGRRQ